MSATIAPLRYLGDGWLMRCSCGEVIHVVTSDGAAWDFWRHGPDARDFSGDAHPWPVTAWLDGLHARQEDTMATTITLPPPATEELMASWPLVGCRRTEHYGETGLDWVEIDYITRGARYISSIASTSAEMTPVGNGSVTARRFLGGKMLEEKTFPPTRGHHARAHNWCWQWVKGA